MPLHSLPISRIEKWNRILWTILSTGYSLIIALFCFWCASALCFQKDIKTSACFAIIALFYTVPIWMVWHCVYKKHGTKLLVFLICIGPILYAISTIFNIFSPSFIYGITIDKLLIQTIFLTIWLGMGLKLYVTNKKLYMNKHCTEEYLAALEEMKASTSLDELTKYQHTLMLQWPELKHHFNKEYKTKKTELTI